MLFKQREHGSYWNRNGKGRGLTLVELLITLALIGVVSLAVLSFYIFGVKTFNRGEMRASDQFDLRMAADFITRDVRYAKSLEFLYSEPSPDSKYCDIFIKDGEICYYKNGVETSIPGISGSDFVLSFSRVSDSILGFTLGKDGETNLKIDTKVSLLNIATSSLKILEDSTKGEVIGIRYVIGTE